MRGLVMVSLSVMTRGSIINPNMAYILSLLFVPLSQTSTSNSGFAYSLKSISWNSSLNKETKEYHHLANCGLLVIFDSHTSTSCYQNFQQNIWLYNTFNIEWLLPCFSFNKLYNFVSASYIILTSMQVQNFVIKCIDYFTCQMIMVLLCLA